MLPPSANLGDGSDAFQLHYAREMQRCVVSYDTLDAALAGACKRLEEDSCLRVWITDASKRAILDDSQVRKRLAQFNPGRHAPKQG